MMHSWRSINARHVDSLKEKDTSLNCTWEIGPFPHILLIYNHFIIDYVGPQGKDRFA